jgi:hypothetical protein
VGSCGDGAVPEVPLDDGGGMVVTGLLAGSGGGGGHTADPILGESGPASLALILVLGFKYVNSTGRSGYVPSACTLIMGSQALV